MHDLFRKCSNCAFLYLAKRKLFAIKILFCKFWHFCSKSGTKIGTRSGTKITLKLQNNLGSIINGFYNKCWGECETNKEIIKKSIKKRNIKTPKIVNFIEKHNKDKVLTLR